MNAIRVCAISDIECSRGCGTGACKKEATPVEACAHDYVRTDGVCTECGGSTKIANCRSEHCPQAAQHAERAAFIEAYMAARPASEAQASDVFDNNWHGKNMWDAGIAYAHATTQQANKGDETALRGSCPDGSNCENGCGRECEKESTASGAHTAPFANCSFRHCDLPGQCKAEGACHHPARAAAPQANKGDELRIAQLEAAVERYCKLADVWRSRTAAPQAVTLSDEQRDALNFALRYTRLVPDGSRMTNALLSLLADRPEQRMSDAEDAARLDWLREECCDLRSISVPTGGDDADVNWIVIQHHMAEPREREIGRGFSDDPRDAIDAARKGNSQ